MVRQIEQASLFDLSAFSRPEKPNVGDWGWENESETPEPEIRRFQVGDRIQAKLPNSPEGAIVEIKQGKYPWSDTLLIEWDKNVPRKQKGTRSAISSGKALLIESYPTESVIDESELSGKTEGFHFQKGDRVRSKFTGAIGTVRSIIRVEGLEFENCDRLSVHWDPGQSNVSSGRVSPEPADKIELIESYPTESVIEEKEATGKTEGVPPDEITDQWGFWINTASDWGEFYWRGNQPIIETSAQECVILEDRGDRWLIVPVGKRPISQEGDGFANGCVKPYEIYKATLSPDPPVSLSYPTESSIDDKHSSGKTIYEQIREKSLEEKKSLLSWLQWVISEEEREPVLPAPKKGRQVVGEPVRTSKGYRRQELVRCGKPTCKTCPHGPYWYEYWSEGGKRRSKYLGKNA